MTKEQNLDKKRHRFKAIEVHGIKYESVAWGESQLGITRTTLLARLQDKNNKDYIYVK